MTIDTIRQICSALPGVTEDVKWGNDLCFCVGGKMFAAMDLNPPHGIGFKCTPGDFSDLIERPGVRPAPYLARAMWVQEEALGEALDRPEFERLLRSAYELVVAKLPKARRPGAVHTRPSSQARPARRSGQTRPARGRSPAGKRQKAKRRR